MADLVRIPRVPILSTGTYQLGTGEFTFTEEDLIAAAAAPATDAAVQWPRVKIDGLSDSFNPDAHGGEPAFGRVENLEVDGQTLYGDFLVPPGLAAVIDWAYPARSVEGAPASVMGPTATGKTHELIITAVALLGVDLPGVSTLPDLMEVLAQFGGESPEQVAVMATVAGGRDGTLADLRDAQQRAIRAGLDQELVRRRFYDATENGADSVAVPEGETGWDLWIRSLRFDDNGSPFLVVESMSSGHLYRYGLAVSGNDANFTLVGEVVEQYVAASAAGRRESVAVWATRDESRAVMANRGGAGMTPEQIAALAAGYGLDPATATEADIMAAAQAAVDARAAEPPADPPPPEPVVPEPVPEPVAASAESRTVTVTAAQWQEMQERLGRTEADLTTRREAEARAHRDGLITAALADGRIAPSEAGMTRNADGTLPEGWRRDLDDAPAATERILARLEPNRVPIRARGVERSDETNTGQGGDDAHKTFMAGYGNHTNRRDVNGVTVIAGGV